LVSQGICTLCARVINRLFYCFDVLMLYVFLLAKEKARYKQLTGMYRSRKRRMLLFWQADVQEPELLYAAVPTIREIKDGTKSEAARQAGKRALQRLTSLPRAALSYIANSKRQRAQRSFRLGLGGSAFGGSLPLWESLKLTLKSAYARKAKRQPSMCFL
jgi:hypothetical protein